MDQDVRNQLKKAYDQNVAERESRRLWRRQVEEREAFASRLNSADLTRLLDAGAATGIDGRFFVDAGFDVTCIDLAAENVKAAQSKGVHALEMDVTQLDFADHSFDAIWSWDCLLHLPKSEWPQALAEIGRVMQPNGLFFLGVYGGVDFEGVWENDTYRPKRFYTFWTDKGLQDLLSQRFKIIDFHTHHISRAAPAAHFQAVTMQQSTKIRHSII